MNENPGEMPNPLNPNNNPLDANPAESQPLEEIVEEVQTVSVTPVEQPANVAPTEQPMNVAPAGEPVTDPMARPMEKAPVAEPVQPKKKKTGLIVAGIIAVVAAIGCGVAAAIIFAMNSGDPVAKAIEKIASGNIPTYVALDGTITLTPSDSNSMLSSLEVALDSKSFTNSMVNSTKATVKASFTNGEFADFSVEEKYGSNGDLYLRLSDITEAINSFVGAMNNTQVETTENCIEDENGETVCNTGTVEKIETVDCETAEDCQALTTPSTITNDGSLDNSNVASSILGSFGGVLEMVDGVWLRVSVDELSSLTSGSGLNNETTCLAEVIANPNKYKSGVIEAYNKNQFISSTTDGVKLASKSGQPVRKIVVNEEKYDSFSNAMKNTTLYNDLSACSSNSSLDSNSSNSLGGLPTVYVEVDKDFNFTRVAFDAPVSDNTTCDCDDLDDCDCGDKVGGSVSVDLSLSYPSTIDVAEPTEYTDLSTLMQQMFLNMYSTSGNNTVAQ